MRIPTELIINPCIGHTYPRMGTLGQDLLGQEPGGTTDMASFFKLLKVSLTPGSPIAKELEKDPKMAKIIKNLRIGTGVLVGGILFFAIRKKRKKKQATTKIVYVQVPKTKAVTK